MTSVMKGCSSALRGLIIAPPGKKLVIADWSNIEGRGIAWLAQEEWKLHVFSDYDKGIGEDVYKSAYAKMFHINPKDVTKAQRQIGKVEELSRGYGGGIGATVRFAITYNIDLDVLANEAFSSMPDEIVYQAKDFLRWHKETKRDTYHLKDKTFIVIDCFKRLWRNAHPKIVGYWSEVEKNCKLAVLNPGETFHCYRHKIHCSGAWLKISMPNGHYLTFPSPRITENKTLSYYGNSQTSKDWGRVETYGGKIVENLTQRFACDILKDALPRIENAGYNVVLTVHDEPITEAPDTEQYSASALSHIMSTPPTWCKGIPLAATGFETYRYRKAD